MLDIYKCFPYKNKNYEKYFINLKVLKTIYEYASSNKNIEKIYAKGSIIYGLMTEGSDIDHVRIKTTTPLTLNEKVKLVSELEDSLKKYNITKIQRIKEDNYVIVDVRTQEEYTSGHVVNAINIPYDEIDETTDLDKDKTIIVYCRSGNRSGKAFTVLKNLGYEVYDLGAYDSIYLDKE